MDWGATLGWSVIIALVAVMVRLTQGGFRVYTCSRCGGSRLSVHRVAKQNDAEIYVCRAGGAGFVREPGRKLVSYDEWTRAVPEARLVAKRGEER